MEYQEVIKEFNRLFIVVLDNEEIVLKEETTANDIEEWDSLTHIHLIVEIEKFFKIKFTAAEIEGFANVGAMCKFVASKTEA